MGRAVKYVNLAILLLLAASAGLVYWFAWRPLPQRSGTVRAPVEAAVLFDTLGVPHIRAAALDDALFAQGYVTAQDRVFQMDLLRKVGFRSTELLHKHSVFAAFGGVK